MIGRQTGSNHAMMIGGSKPETGSISPSPNEICNLQILKGAESAKSARMPNRSCKSLAKFYFYVRKYGDGKSCLRSDGGNGLVLNIS
jgi:hypothetical protein